jgi:hypothetical protein
VYCCEKSSYRGQDATKVTIVKWRGEGGRVFRSFILPHTELLYSLYDTRDYEVKLTKTGKTSSFDASNI